MATNYQQEGAVIQWTNGTGSTVNSGAVVKINNLIGIALQTIANGAAGSVAIEGVFRGLPKVAATNITQGQKLLWDVSEAKFDGPGATPATGDVTGGAIAFEAAGSSVATITVKLTPGNTAIA